MIRDVNGGELRAGGLALLLCEVLAVDSEMVHIRVMNSEMELAVGVHQDEVLGAVVDPELNAFVPMDPGIVKNDPECDSVAILTFE